MLLHAEKPVAQEKAAGVVFFRLFSKVFCARMRLYLRFFHRKSMKNYDFSSIEPKLPSFAKATESRQKA